MASVSIRAWHRHRIAVTTACSGDAAELTEGGYTTGGAPPLGGSAYEQDYDQGLVGAVVQVKG